VITYPRITLVLLIALSGLILSPTIVPVESQSQVQAKYPTSYHFYVTFHDFRDADQSTNISIHFDAQFALVSGSPGLYGMDLRDVATGGAAHRETNGRCIYEDCTAAGWFFDFSVRFRGLGAGDFYPYDKWMFNLTLNTPLLSLANKTNLDMSAGSNAYGWEIAGTPIRELGQSSWGPVVMTIVLQRAGWTVFPIRFIPILLFIVLGLLVLIPADDLSSKTTVVTAVIFFILTSILGFGPSLPPRLYGLSFAEIDFYYLLLLAAVYLAESILEKRIIPRTRKHTQKEDRRYAMHLFPVAVTAFLAYSYTGSFGHLAKVYPWSALPIIETFALPPVAVAVGTVVDELLTNGGTLRHRLAKWLEKFSLA
jgi:hypothetical protein